MLGRQMCGRQAGGQLGWAVVGLPGVEVGC